MVVITVNPKIFGGIGRTEEVLPRVEIFTVPLQSPTTRLDRRCPPAKWLVDRRGLLSLALVAEGDWTNPRLHYSAIDVFHQTSLESSGSMSSSL
ncbi:hypothetical protein YC2023_079335 [Brassica napus]